MTPLLKGGAGLSGLGRTSAFLWDRFQFLRMTWQVVWSVSATRQIFAGGVPWKKENTGWKTLEAGLLDGVCPFACLLCSFSSIQLWFQVEIQQNTRIYQKGSQAIGQGGRSQNHCFPGWTWERNTSILVQKQNTQENFALWPQVFCSHRRKPCLWHCGAQNRAPDPIDARLMVFCSSEIRLQRLLSNSIHTGIISRTLSD